MKKIILFRGTPGSGKSTLAKTLCDIAIEADDYFMKDNHYVFIETELNLAHLWCQAETERAMLKQLEIIGVANTFTTEKEMSVYFQLAKKYKYSIHTVIVENRHNGINTHGCPEEKIEKMRDRLKNNIKI